MTQPKPVDYVISAKWILPIIPAGAVFRDCCLIVHQGRIEAIRPTEDVGQAFAADVFISLSDHVLMPGLVNAHGHAAMSLLRGYADDLPLSTWLQDHIWPTESQWVDEHFVRDGAQLALAEMVLSGTTCFSDMYYFPEVTAAAAHQAGVRAQITFPILDFPTVWATDADDYIHKGLKLHDHYRSSDRIHIGFGPHAPYTVSDAPLKRIAMLAHELQAPIHIHLHETEQEVQQSLADYGVRPIERLANLGVLSPLTQCVHMTQVSDGDIELLQSTGASVVHCPESNLKLANGVCPVQQLLTADVTVGLGTDGGASNNDLDMFGELATAALIGKLAAKDAAAVSAQTALHMATLGSAKALGMDSEIGSLEVGKAADIIAVAVDHVSANPIYNIMSHLVYNNRRLNVTHAWVAGRALLQDGRLVTLNEREIMQRVKQWQQRLSSSTA